MKFKCPIFSFEMPFPEFRPFRTSAIILSLVIVGIMALMVFGNSPGVAIAGAGQAGGTIDGVVLGIVFTGLVGCIIKLSDDGGESDVIKAVNRFIDHLDKR